MLTLLLATLACVAVVDGHWGFPADRPPVAPFNDDIFRNNVCGGSNATVPTVSLVDRRGILTDSNGDLVDTVCLYVEQAPLSFTQNVTMSSAACSVNGTTVSVTYSFEQNNVPVVETVTCAMEVNIITQCNNARRRTGTRDQSGQKRSALQADFPCHLRKSRTECLEGCWDYLLGSTTTLGAVDCRCLFDHSLINGTSNEDAPTFCPDSICCYNSPCDRADATFFSGADVEEQCLLQGGATDTVEGNCAYDPTATGYVSPDSTYEDSTCRCRSDLTVIGSVLDLFFLTDLDEPQENFSAPYDCFCPFYDPLEWVSVALAGGECTDPNNISDLPDFVTTELASQLGALITTVNQQAYLSQCRMRRLNIWKLSGKSLSSVCRAVVSFLTNSNVECGIVTLTSTLCQIASPYGEATSGVDQLIDDELYALEIIDDAEDGTTAPTGDGPLAAAAADQEAAAPVAALAGALLGVAALAAL